VEIILRQLYQLKPLVCDVKEVLTYHCVGLVKSREGLSVCQIGDIIPQVLTQTIVMKVKSDNSQQLVQFDGGLSLFQKHQGSPKEVSSRSCRSYLVQYPVDVARQETGSGEEYRQESVLDDS
jgi:hypothetical protein